MIWSKRQIEELIKELISDGPIGDAEAFDIVDGILFEEDGLARGINKHFRVIDVQGWLANQIA